MLPETEIEALAARFYALFAPGETGHGVYTLIGDGTDGGSTKGKLDHAHKEFVREPVTTELWALHLTGKRGLGVVPIRQDGTVMWGAIDIDDYTINHVELAGKLLALDLPLIVCRSKSGGAHLYLFTSEPMTAYAMQAKLRDIAAMLGHGNVEVFPKQTKMADGGNGSWLNMPYFDGDNGARYAVRPDGERLTMEQFLARAEQSSIDMAWFKNAGSVTKKRESAKPRFFIPDVIADGMRNSTLTSFAGSLRRSGASSDTILVALRQTNAEKCKPPLEDSEIETIAKSVAHYTPNAASDEGLTHELAKVITADASFARDAGGRLYHFEDGVYRPTGKRVVERRVKELCQVLSKAKSWNPELAARVEAWIVCDAPELWERPPLDVLNVRNGLLNVATRSLAPHSPAHLSPVQIAASFDPDATCPHIDKFVRDVFPDDATRLPYEVPAWLTLPDTSIQKAVLLLGGGANGKSAWLNLLIAFLGKENVSAISLHRLEADKFSAARLVGKLANISADLPTAALSGTSMFKALTGGDSISVERKFEASFELQPFVRLLFSANSAPRSDDSTDGFFRRWLCIPFNRIFEENAPDTVPRAVLDAQLTEPGELSGLLNRALDALPAIRAGRFSESNSTRAALAEFRSTTDPLGVWLDSNTVERPDAVIPKEQLRSAYGTVCHDAGRPVLGDVQFTAALKRLRPRVQAAQRRVDKRMVRVFAGIGLVTQDLPPDGQLF